MDTIAHVSGDAGTATVFGDLHGQYSDLVSVLDDHGLPGDSKVYIFNGTLA